jgi:hypothetical protein
MMESEARIRMARGSDECVRFMTFSLHGKGGRIEKPTPPRPSIFKSTSF